ncbi:MAG: cytochrome b [Devosia sp.]
MAMKSSATRYGSGPIAIHWLTAALIVALFATGLLATGQTDPTAELALIRFHVPLGISVLVLTLLRIVWWWFIDRRPSPVAGQPALQQRVAGLVHLALYVVILVLASSGIATLVLSGAMPAIIAGTALPNFDDLLPRLVHGLVARLMLVLLALHIGAALYHQFIRRDRLLARMGVGRA